MHLRTLFRPILRHLYAPIAGGPNEGLLCSRACGPGYRLGRYERDRWESLAPMISPGDVFWDVGAHYGYVTLLAHRRVGPEGRVLAFEPSGRNRSYLTGHVRANRAANVEVLALALADYEGEAKFGGGTGSGTRRLGVGAGTTRVRTMDGLVGTQTCPKPTWIKIDVEGAEAAVLRGAAATMRGQPTLALVATHSNDLHAECLAILSDYGYDCHVPQRSQAALAGGVGTMETEILAIGSGRSAGDLTRFLTGG